MGECAVEALVKLGQRRGVYHAFRGQDISRLAVEFADPTFSPQFEQVVP